MTTASQAIPPHSTGQAPPPVSGAQASPSPAPIRVGREDTVQVTPEILARASEQRVQQIQRQIAEMLLRLEGELFRSLAQHSVPGAKSAQHPADPGMWLGPQGESAHSQSTIQEIIERVAPEIARLARISPETVRALLARYQLLALSFPVSTRALVTQLGGHAEQSLADLVAFLMQPRSANAPTHIPEGLRALIGGDARMQILLKTAGEITDQIRTGGVSPRTDQGRVPPARVTMDGISSGVLAPRASALSQSPSALNSLRAGVGSGQQVGVGVDVISISDAGRGLASALGVEVLVDVNQVLSDRLGMDNPLQLSGSRLQVGVRMTTGQGDSASSQVESLASRLADRLVALRQTNPEGFEKLITLLRALARMNPDRFTGLLRQVESNLAQMAAAQQSTSPPPVPLPPAAGGGISQGQVLTVRVEVEVNQRTDMIVADLRAAGFEARAVQSSSVTEIEVTVRLGQDGVQRGDPLIIDLAADGVELTGRGTEFDLNADGQIDRSAFVRGDDALLMVDRDGDGRLTDGAELFGDQEGDASGFAKLAKHDSNGDGAIDAKDAIFDKLRVVYDKSGDGRTDLDELASLTDVGIAKISLSRAAMEHEDAHGNRIHERAAVTREDGTQASIYEADLTFE